MKALITISNESLEVAFNNREPSLVSFQNFLFLKEFNFVLKFQFAVVKLLEMSLVNLKRIDFIWNLLVSHLIDGL